MLLFSMTGVRGFILNLLKESKTRHFNNLNVRDVTENKRFGKQ